MGKLTYYYYYLQGQLLLLLLFLLPPAATPTTTTNACYLRMPIGMCGRLGICLFQIIWMVEVNVVSIKRLATCISRRCTKLKLD